MNGESKPEPVDWSWRFDGFGGAAGAVHAEALCDTQDPRQPDVMNHWTAADRVKTVSMAVSPKGIVLPALSAAAIECEMK